MFNFFKSKEKELSDIDIKISDRKEELSNLSNKIELLESTLSEHDKLKNLNENIIEKEQSLASLSDKLHKLESELSEYDNLKTINDRILDANSYLDSLNQEIALANDEIDLQNVGFYNRRYKFSDSEEYKNELKSIRELEKSAVRDGSAGIITAPMTLDNSLAKGKSMQKKLIKAAIRGLNGEADALLTKINVSNVDVKVNSLHKTVEQLNKMYAQNLIAISDYYMGLKQQELYLAAEFEMEKQREKDLLREQREQEREEKKVQQELAAQRKKLSKERLHYENILDDLRKKLSDGDNSAEIEQQIAEYEGQLSIIDEASADIDYRQGHASAGYVYIISNIGSFGPDIFKIGVTRRLEPMERINELGSASVPFPFDVHALIFSEDAFALESDLHRKFEANKVNKVNGRKEYFKVQLDDIKNELKNHENISVEIVDQPESFEFNQSLIS